MSEWIQWNKQRPPNGEKKYRWRIPECMILGKLLRPEWVDKLYLVGMGYGEDEWWPGFSDWNGYSRKVPNGLEWRELEENENEKIIWGGLDLLPCPFSGCPPFVDYHGQWVTAPPYRPEYLILKMRFGTSTWNDANNLQERWNTRAAI